MQVCNRLFRKIKLCLGMYVVSFKTSNHFHGLNCEKLEFWRMARKAQLSPGVHIAIQKCLVKVQVNHWWNSNLRFLDGNEQNSWQTSRDYDRNSDVWLKKRYFRLAFMLLFSIRKYLLWKFEWAILEGFGWLLIKVLTVRPVHTKSHYATRNRGSVNRLKSQASITLA